MKKIMFNDKYGLTDAVLSGRKTQTRRIIPSADHTNSWLEGTLVITDKKGCKQIMAQFSDKRVLSAYAIGEVVAIAQAYRDFFRFCGLTERGIKELKQNPGWNNKMFVKPSLMPHHIRITNVRVELLQDISDKDCLAEGINTFTLPQTEEQLYSYRPMKLGMNSRYVFPTSEDAYVALIDKVSGRGTWDANPYVFVYEFELVD